MKVVERKTYHYFFILTKLKHFTKVSKTTVRYMKSLNQEKEIIKMSKFVETNEKIAEGVEDAKKRLSGDK